MQGLHKAEFASLHVLPLQAFLIPFTQYDPLGQGLHVDSFASLHEVPLHCRLIPLSQIEPAVVIKKEKRRDDDYTCSDRYNT